MFKHIGRSLARGAKAEITENPPPILDQGRWADLLETGLIFATLALMALGGRKAKQPVTVIVNNYIQKG